ncbi:polysaccharide deacetylase family protein [Bradyrhizobium genosp. P]|uniref:polysaccharide deacetylase family protein n=1 Tax=Bradyrhizobium genosp. P TaxID=83641 RepID=UPI003CFADB08
MLASVLVGIRKRSWTVIGGALLGCFMAQAALAEDCPGNPNALGTSRTLVVDPRAHPRIGTMQYPETLPLADHEVVLTFDDGPLPKHSNQILAILASQCIKATFFTIGSQANASPEGVRKLAAAGHTIGTHTQHHPLTMNKMPIDKAKQEIDDGIASTLAALNGDRSKLAPFFRIPGLLRATAVEDYLASQGIQVWSADFPADDWRHISPQRVYDLAIQRIEARGKGILLLHDIQPRTVAALPRILNELKARGYHIVHVVPATPDLPATPTDPQDWYMHPPSERVALKRWPSVPNFVFTASRTLPSPVFSDLDWRDAEALDHAQHARIGEPRRALWPQPLVAQPSSAATLPVPAAGVFTIPEGERPTLLAARPRAARVASAAAARSEALSAHQAKHPKRTAHLPPAAAHGNGRVAPQHAEQTGKPGSVRVASLKKRSPRAEATAIAKRVPD